MGRPSKYPPELRERAVRMVHESGMKRSRMRTLVIGAAAALAASGVSACGSSSSTARALVPDVRGLGVQQAADQICEVGFRVQDAIYLPDAAGAPVKPPAGYSASPVIIQHGHPVNLYPTVTMTTPPAGVIAVPGSIVSITGSGLVQPIVVNVPHCAVPAAPNTPVRQ